jgi:hypothetical protein
MVYSIHDLFDIEVALLEYSSYKFHIKKSSFSLLE